MLSIYKKFNHQPVTVSITTPVPPSVPTSATSPVSASATATSSVSIIISATFIVPASVPPISAVPVTISVGVGRVSVRTEVGRRSRVRRITRRRSTVGCWVQASSSRRRNTPLGRGCGLESSHHVVGLIVLVEWVGGIELIVFQIRRRNAWWWDTKSGGWNTKVHCRQHL